MCEAGVTNVEPSEDNSFSTVKVAQFTTAKGRPTRPPGGCSIE